MGLPLTVIGFSMATAILCAVVVGVPLGLGLTVGEFRFRRALIAASTILLGLPPVLIGLAMYALGCTEMPHATLMIPALALLSLPTVVAIVHRGAAGVYERYRTELRLAGAGWLRRGWMMLILTRSGIAAAVLAAIGRSVCEFGVILVLDPTAAPNKGTTLLLLGAIIVGSTLACGAAFAVSARRS